MQLPTPQNLAIQPLTTAFANTATSYKFYWFLALLKMVQANKKAVDLTELSVSMVVGVWYPYHYFKINFGNADQLGNLAKEALLLPELGLKIETEEQELVTKILDFVTKNPKHDFSKKIFALQNYVPFRFIRPWLEGNLEKGLKDRELNEKIRNLATAGTRLQLPYYFSGAQLIFDENWWGYFNQHLRIVRDFCLWNLLLYLQKRNANAPNIAAKLFPPSSSDRSLTAQHTFWKAILAAQPTPIRCIYSDQIIQDKYSLDHFIPWSFVTHNQLWNLAPVPKSVNSQKSNYLPNLNLYFEPFAALQYRAFHAGLQLNMVKKLEDYTLLFGADLPQIKQFSPDEFKTKLQQQIVPLSQIAANMGFAQDWIYT